MNDTDLTEPETTDEIDPKRKRLAFEVYQQTWTDFYKWEQDSSGYALKALGVAFPGWDELEPMKSMEYENQEFHPELMGSYDTGSETFTVERYDEVGNCIHYATITSVGYPVPDKLPAHPNYEICTPASQNHAPATTIYDAMAAFIPYADDPDFPALEYLEDFVSFSWQKDFEDPDLEVIQLEAVRRLHLYNDFSLEDIDKLGFFPPTRVSPVDGLLWSAAQRDIPWQGLPLEFFQAPPLPRNFALNTPDLFATINQDVPSFCPSLNCLRTLCPTHRPYKYPPVDPVKPKLTGADLKSTKGRPCGEDCFRLVDEEDYLDGIFWEDANDAKTIESMLKLIPDQSPCDLAVICRKRCREVFAYRCMLLPDEKIIEELYQEERPRFVMPKFVDLVSENDNGQVETPNFTPLFPCHHKGPCDQNSTCPCYMEGQHCQRNCRCELECRIRWEGCDCRPSMSGAACLSPEDCICRQMGRECDPEICIGCDARGKYIPARTKRKPACRNVDLQRGISKGYIHIDRGAYGLGAHARVSIKADVVIGEYIGEILPTELLAHRDYIHRHTKFNYGFDLNAYTSLDSARLGNDTRYLNDARPSGKPGEQENNCDARIRLVNGDHRIAIVTLKAVEASQELFLDYGPKYWVNDNQYHDN